MDALCACSPFHDVPFTFPVPRAIWLSPPLIFKPTLSQVSTTSKLYKSCFFWGGAGLVVGGRMKGHHLQIVGSECVSIPGMPALSQLAHYGAEDTAPMKGIPDFSDRKVKETSGWS